MINDTKNHVVYRVENDEILFLCLESHSHLGERKLWTPYLDAASGLTATRFDSREAANQATKVTMDGRTSFCCEVGVAERMLKDAETDCVIYYNESTLKPMFYVERPGGYPSYSWATDVNNATVVKRKQLNSLMRRLVFNNQNLPKLTSSMLRWVSLQVLQGKAQLPTTEAGSKNLSIAYRSIGDLFIVYRSIGAGRYMFYQEVGGREPSRNWTPFVDQATVLGTIALEDVMARLKDDVVKSAYLHKDDALRRFADSSTGGLKDCYIYFSMDRADGNGARHMFLAEYEDGGVKMVPSKEKAQALSKEEAEKLHETLEQDGYDCGVDYPQKATTTLPKLVTREEAIRTLMDHTSAPDLNWYFPYANASIEAILKSHGEEAIIQEWCPVNSFACAYLRHVPDGDLEDLISYWMSEVDSYVRCRDSFLRGITSPRTTLWILKSEKERREKL